MIFKSHHFIDYISFSEKHNISDKEPKSSFEDVGADDTQADSVSLRAGRLDSQLEVYPRRYLHRRIVQLYI